MTACRFLEPVDVLFLRGNKLFGDAGSYGESLIPPWPSVAAGAIRSQMLAEEGIDLIAFAGGTVAHPALGTPELPGSFAVTGFHLARRQGDRIESLHLLPADLLALRADDGAITLKRLEPVPPHAGIEGSHPLPMWPLLATDKQAKPAGSVWLTQAGWQRYLNGGLPEAGEIIESKNLWKTDPRVGVGLDPDRRRASDGKLFTVQAVALREGHGFLALIDGAEPPASGTLRLGGDGRAAAVSVADYQSPEPDYDAIAQAGRCRIVLTSPGIFPSGWYPPGCDAEGNFELGGIRGRLISAAVPRAETVSGWDLAAKQGKGQPKPARQTTPAGSVYWIDHLETTVEALRKLVAQGLWPDQGYDAQRRAEGFNRFTFASY